jgi:hypothetical protein
VSDLAQKLAPYSSLVQAGTAFVVTVFTGLLVLYSHRGWKVAKEAADASTKAAEAAKASAEAAIATVGVLRTEQRAWLAVEDLSLHITGKDPNGTDIGVVNGFIVNHGLTPATGVRDNLSAEARLAFQTHIPDLTREQSATPDIAPSGRHEFSKPFTKPENSGICVYGRINYAHGFGQGQTILCRLLVNESVSVTFGPNEIR